jgi:esterase/lipase
VASRPKSATYVYDHLGSEDRRLVWMGEAPHGLMHGSEDEKAILHREIVEFLSSRN